jgi:hypothetical protein
MEMKNKFKIIETPDYILAVSDETRSLDSEKIKNEYYLGSDNKIHRLNETNLLYFRGKSVAYLPKGNAPELDLPLLPEMVVENYILEDRIYCVDVQNYEFDTAPQTWDDKKFILESEIQGNVYSIKGFITAFNKTEINQDNLIIRFIKDEMVVEDNIEKFIKKEFGFSDEMLKNWEKSLSSNKYADYGNILNLISKAATKMYSEEDLRKAIQFVTDNYTIDSWQNYDKKSGVNMSSGAIADKFIQSLKQPKWFVAEYKTEYTEDGLDYQSDELKTTTINGKTYLVGKYLNE